MFDSGQVKKVRTENNKNKRTRSNRFRNKKQECCPDEPKSRTKNPKINQVFKNMEFPVGSEIMRKDQANNYQKKWKEEACIPKNVPKQY